MGKSRKRTKVEGGGDCKMSERPEDIMEKWEGVQATQEMKKQFIKTIEKLEKSRKGKPQGKTLVEVFGMSPGKGDKKGNKRK